jgi:hypothetical protein
MGKDRVKGVDLSLPIYSFPNKKRVHKKVRKQGTTKAIIDKINRQINEYDPNQDYFLKDFKRKLKDIWR